MGKNLNNQIKQATKWSSVTEIVAKLVSPVVNMVLARLLAPEEFGVVATITMVISFAEIFTDAGFQKYIIQHEFRNEDELNRSTNVAFWTNLTVSVCACVIIFIFRETIADMVGSAGLGNAISIASLLILVAAFSSIQMARYKRDFDFKTLFFVRIGSALIPLIVTLPLAFVLRNYWALLIGNFVCQLFSAIVLTLKSNWRPSLYYNVKLLKDMFAFSAWTLLESISIWLTSYVGIFIVGSYLNSYYLGLYKTSMSTVNAYMTIITSAITPVLFSALSRYQNDQRNYEKTFYTFQRMTAILIIPMGIGLFVFRELVTSILLGKQWLEISDFVGLWGLTSAFTIIFSHFSSEVFRSKGNPKLSLLLQMFHLLFLIPSLIVAVRVGFTALYITRALVRIQLVISAMIIIHVKYGIKIDDMIRNTFPMFFSAIIMGVCGVGLRKISETIVWQFVAVFMCIVVYFLVLLAFFPKLRKELLEVTYIKKLKRKFTMKV